MTTMPLRIQIAVFDGFDEIDVFGIIVPGGGWLNRAEAGGWGEVERGALPARLAELAPTLPWLASVCSGGMIVASAGSHG